MYTEILADQLCRRGTYLNILLFPELLDESASNPDGCEQIFFIF